ncbi:MAG TPA: hypothetical protein VN776_15105 [Terracidiphilus sp.]|nr:hypothetical protein [Terracidiphilus sp.]
MKISIVPALLAAANLAPAAQLSTDARTAIPHEVQQLVVIDYRAMQNSAAAMDLRARVMPPELKQFDEALTKSGLNDNHDVEQLAFALFRPSPSSESLITVGIAQGQFPEQDILANFRKNKVKPALVRTNKVYPLAKTGMVLCFVDASTMVFGPKDAVEKALDARDGVSPSLLTNNSMMDAMKTVDTASLWSILDEKGTRTMMKQVLGEAGALTDFETVQKRLQLSWYGMDFQHGVKFDLTISTGDTFAAATISSLLTAAVMVRKLSGSDAEKQALSETAIASDSGRMSIHFAASDSDFSSLLHSPLFQSMVH